MAKQSHPQDGVEYAGGPEAFRAHSYREASRSLARHLGITESRALDLLDDPLGLAAEIRSHQAATIGCPWCRQDAGLPLTGRQARQIMDERYPPQPWAS